LLSQFHPICSITYTTMENPIDRTMLNLVAGPTWLHVTKKVSHFDERRCSSLYDLRAGYSARGHRPACNPTRPRRKWIKRFLTEIWVLLCQPQRFPRGSFEHER
jgi:hypothetical protein